MARRVLLHPVMVLLHLAACANDVTYAPATRLLDSYSYVDAGVIAVGDRQTFTVPLFSRGKGPVTIFGIATEDVQIPTGAEPGAFIVHPEAWAGVGCDNDGDGTDDCLELAAYDDSSDDDTLALPVIFAPTALGSYESLLTVWSNDSESTQEEPLPGDNRARTIWRVQLRGRADVPCARVWPSFLDFGARAAGGEFADTVHIENCGVVSVIVSSARAEASDVFATETFPLYILPGATEDVGVAWQVPAGGDGTAAATDTELTFTSNADDLEGRSVRVIGNQCAESVDPGWDGDNDGWTTCGGDCDDGDATTHPGAVDRAGTGEDEDCDGVIDEVGSVSTDDDADGATELEGDCDDEDPAVSPAAVESADGVDDDCDGAVDEDTERSDDDGDGWAEREGDCDDANRLISPTVSETTDGADNDCDGVVDEGSYDVDDDGDGITENDSPSDCDDQDPWVYPGANEFCDAYDNDCDHDIDEGADDAPDGACAFLPERAEPTTPDAASGCAVGHGSAATPGALLAAFALALRTRKR